MANNTFELYDSDVISDSMKERMRVILTKFNNGISCNKFMDIYANEYNSHFTFSEYGFKSMKDMAYKLPSVFYVKMDEKNNECILYNVQKRVELESNFNDPTKYYKNIPKTVLHNLSVFFNNHRTEISFNELRRLYCVEFGRSYEPLKYGYISEKHMFESLDKMVKIKNDKLYTLDPFAYTDFIEDEDTLNINKSSLPMLPVDNLLMTYPGKDVCNGQFVYQNFMLNNAKSLNVYIGEIYSSSSFYIQKYSSVKILDRFMADLQAFYEKNEDYYKVVPELLTVGLACTSHFENSGIWHRAKILKIFDENSVQLLYVDYGSLETVKKSDIRLLSTQFSKLPIQSLHCTLYECDKLNVPREINIYFADLIENKKLEAKFHKMSSNDINEKKPVTLYLKRNNEKINLNKEFLIKLKQGKENNEIRRMILKFDELSE